MSRQAGARTDTTKNRQPAIYASRACICRTLSGKRFRCFSRSQIPRYSQHRSQCFGSGSLTGCVDGQCARQRWSGHAQCGKRCDKAIRQRCRDGWWHSSYRCHRANHRLAKLAREAALDGVVCSPHEVGLIRSIAKNNFLTVTPGVRPDPASAVPLSTISSHGGKPDDQRRTLTPFDAILAGSDFLVIGRPITQAASPVDVLAALAAEVQIAAAQASVG